MLQMSIDNEQLAPLLAYRAVPISLKAFRKILHFLPSLSKTSRNDHKFGASTYLANTLGIMLQPSESCRIMDEPLNVRQMNNLWRQAPLLRRCQQNTQDSTIHGA